MCSVIEIERVTCACMLIGLMLRGIERDVARALSCAIIIYCCAMYLGREGMLIYFSKVPGTTDIDERRAPPPRPRCEV